MHRITPPPPPPSTERGSGFTQTHRHAQIDIPSLVLKGLRPHPSTQACTDWLPLPGTEGVKATHRHAQTDFPSLALKGLRPHPDTQAAVRWVFRRHRRRGSAVPGSARASVCRRTGRWTRGECPTAPRGSRLPLPLMAALSGISVLVKAVALL